MQFVRASRFGLLIAALTVTAAQAMAAPDANAILKKAQESMLSLNTYQATMLMTMDMGQMGSMAMNSDLKMKPKQNKFAMKMSPTGAPTGQMAMAAQMMNMTIVADGKNMYMYMPAMKGYRKGPIDKRMMNPGSMAFQQAGKGKPKYIRTENVSGKPAHVLQVIPDPRTIGGAKGDMLLFLDAATSRFRQMTMKMSAPGGSAGQPGMTQTMKLLVKNEVVNAPIPDSVFRFVPPPGAKEMKGGPGGMGGMGGMMGGGPPRR